MKFPGGGRIPRKRQLSLDLPSPTLSAKLFALTLLVAASICGGLLLVAVAELTMLIPGLREAHGDAVADGMSVRLLYALAGLGVGLVLGRGTRS